MTVEEIRKKYGDEDGVIHCCDCPLTKSGVDCCKGEYDKISSCTDTIQFFLSKTTPEQPKQPNNVEHPNHYNQEGAMECIDEMVLVFGKEATMNFCLLNVWKYRYRANAKNGKEDMDKANEYMKLYKKLKESAD